MKKSTLILPARMVLLTVSSVIVFFTGCDMQLFNKPAVPEPVARVNEKYLFRSDLEEPTNGLDPEDSLVVAKRFIDNWIMEQLMLYRAELALSNEQKNFEKQIEEYRKSLLIYSYRQKLLQQKLDTVVTAEEVSEYYENNISNFILSEEIIRGTFVKVPLEAPRINEVRAWSADNSPEALNELEKYCINYAQKYSDFNNNWIRFSSIRDQVPSLKNRPPGYLAYNRNIESSDSLSTCFLHISGYKPEGDVAPLDLVTGDIRSIILNKRKIEFFHELESRVYNEGISKNQFEIY